MNIKNIKNFKFNKNNLTFDKIKNSFLDFLLNRFRIIFMSIFLIASILGGFMIYKYMYNSEWTEAQKIEYRMQIESKKKTLVMSEFNNIIERIKNRKRIEDKGLTISKDIFETEDSL